QSSTRSGGTTEFATSTCRPPRAESGKRLREPKKPIIRVSYSDHDFVIPAATVAAARNKPSHMVFARDWQIQLKGGFDEICFRDCSGCCVCFGRGGGPCARGSDRRPQGVDEIKWAGCRRYCQDG